MNEQEQTVLCWGCDAGSITMETRRLIELLIRNKFNISHSDDKSLFTNDTHKQLSSLGIWLNEQIKAYDNLGGFQPLPDAYASITGFEDEKSSFCCRGYSRFSAC